MHGRQALLNFFDTATPQQAEAVSVRRGRSAEEIARRNEYIFHRYYYYFTFCTVKPEYDAVIIKLNEEVWLSTTTIIDILQNNLSRLGEIRKEAPGISQLKKKWPHIQW